MEHTTGELDENAKPDKIKYQNQGLVASSMVAKQLKQSSNSQSSNVRQNRNINLDNIPQVNIKNPHSIYSEDERANPNLTAASPNIAAKTQ